MIGLNFSIRNPWSTTFKNLWSTAFGTPFKHKYIELEVYKDCSIISFNFRWSIRQSHAGLDLELGLFSYCVHFNFYDNRHWNGERWCVYSEEEGLH